HVRGERAIGIKTAAFGNELDPVDMQITQAVGFFLRSLTLDPKKPAMLLHAFVEIGVELRLIEAENGRHQFGRDVDIRDEQRIDVNRFHRKAHRQALAVAVEDGAARRAYFDEVFLLLLGEMTEFVVAYYLKLNEAEENERGPDEGDSGQPADPGR